MRPASWKGLVGLVLAVYLGLSAYAAWCYSPVGQEPPQLFAGMAAWRFGRFGFFHVNPPLTRIVATLPLQFAGLECDAETFDRVPIGREEYAMANAFLGENSGKSRWMFGIARWTCLCFGLIGGYCCWRFASSLYGGAAGVVALVLWCFCPYVLGHGATIVTDVPAAAVGVMAVYCFWRWLKKPHWQNALLLGLALGLAELSKFTLLVFYPLLPALWCVHRLASWKSMSRAQWQRQAGMLVVTTVVSGYIINCGYLFEGSFSHLGAFRFHSMAFTGCDSLAAIPPEGANRFAGTWMANLPVPLPANYLQGMDTQKVDFEQGLPSYLCGQWSRHGWWWYYLYAWLIKLPLGTWGLVVLAIGASCLGRAYSAAWYDEMIVLAPCVVIFAFISSQTGFSIHSRYAVPALPFLFIWSSKVVRLVEMAPQAPRRAAMATVIVLALSWSVGSTLWHYPHSISYFNELVGGGRNGPKYLLDSNIDWGQDLFYLRGWLDANSDVPLDGLAYWGLCPASIAGIPETPSPHVVPGEENDLYLSDGKYGPRSGWYALSVNEIYGRDQRYRYFLHFQPVAMAGYSIYIYHISAEEADRVRQVLGMPSLPGRTKFDPEPAATGS